MITWHDNPSHPFVSKENNNINRYHPSLWPKTELILHSNLLIPPRPTAPPKSNNHWPLLPNSHSVQIGKTKNSFKINEPSILINLFCTKFNFDFKISLSWWLFGRDGGLRIVVLSTEQKRENEKHEWNKYSRRNSPVDCLMSYSPSSGVSYFVVAGRNW